MTADERAFVDSLHHMLQVAIDTAFITILAVVVIAMLVGFMTVIYLTGNTIERWWRKRPPSKGAMPDETHP